MTSPPPSPGSPGSPGGSTALASAAAVQTKVEDDRTGMDDVTLRRAFLDHLQYSLGKRAVNSTALDRFVALALTVRDRLAFRRAATQEHTPKAAANRSPPLPSHFL